MVVGGRELIDTLWNVNNRRYSSFLRTLRINRYIMECKFSGSKADTIIPALELIDTLWNVNLLFVSAYS